MKDFIICAHTFASFGYRSTHFVRIIHATNKDQAIKVFLKHYGFQIAIDRVIENK